VMVLVLKIVGAVTVGPALTAGYAAGVAVLLVVGHGASAKDASSDSPSRP